MVETSRLRFLQAVHRCGAVGAAARQLGYTPSAVSQQIGKLEREVGLPLLEPAGRGVVLTDAALVLVEAASAIDQAREQANGRIEELLAVASGETVGTVSVACFPSAIRGVAAPALGALAQTAPRLRVDLVELAPEPALEAVVSGRVDVAVVHDWVHDRTTFPASLETTHLADDPVDLLVPTSHPLATRSTARLEETVDDVWVTDVSNGICTRWILDMLRASATEPRVDYRVEEYASQVALVADGLCVCVLPRIGRPSLPGTVRAVPLEGPVPTRRLIAAHRTTTSRRPAVRQLIEALRGQVPG